MPRHYLLLFAAVMLFCSLLQRPADAAVTLVVGHEQNHPMVSTGDNGRPRGIMIDILEEVAQREGWNLTYAPCVWNQCLENLEHGRIDLLVGIAFTPERAERFSFNQHTVISNWGLLYSRPDQKIESYTDLKGKRIAVVKNDVYSNAFIRMLQQFDINCMLVEAENFKKIFAMIDEGTVHAGVANRFFSLLNEKGFKVKSTPIIFSPVSVQVAAPKGNHADILAVYDRHLEQLKKDQNSAYHQSLKRWLGIEGAGYRLPAWVGWLLAGIGGSMLLLVVFIGLLRREVRRKTADLSHEVTERRRSEEQLRLVLDNMQEVFVRTTLEGTITFLSPGISLLGYQPEQLLRGPFQNLCCDPADFNALIRQLELHGSITGHRICLLHQNGTERLISLNAQLISPEADSSPTMIASGTDVTEQVRMGELMAQTEKMMMVGGLAAGMAHEINNPLGIIIQNIQNIERRVSADLPANLQAAAAVGIELPLVRAYLDQRGIFTFMRQMHAAGERMTRIISSMLKFSRKSESRIESADLRQVLDQAIELAANDYDLKKHYDFKRIEIIRDYAPDLPNVPITILEIEQVLLNLLKNAAQAMAFAQNKKEHRIVLRTRLSDEWALIEVEDNGPGISCEVQRRIFDPFFTTKEVGVGTGLGLSVSYAIITNNHRGRLEVRSEPGNGTCFIIKLPLVYHPVGKVTGEAS